MDTVLTGNVHRGITNVVMRAFDPVRTWELIDEEKVTVALAVSPFASCTPGAMVNTFW